MGYTVYKYIYTLVNDMAFDIKDKTNIMTGNWDRTHHNLVALVTKLVYNKFTLWPKNYGKSPFLRGKSTISMAMFNSYVKLPEAK